MRLIDADAATFPTPHRKEVNDYMRGWNLCLSSVLQQPAVDAVPVVYGDWRVIEAEDGRALCECGVCKDWVVFYYDYMPNFCPNCGAKRRLTATCKEATE